MYMDDNKLFPKNKKKIGLEILIQEVRINYQNIGKEFGKEKCTMQIMKSWKREMTEGIELPN